MKETTLHLTFQIALSTKHTVITFGFKILRKKRSFKYTTQSKEQKLRHGHTSHTTRLFLFSQIRLQGRYHGVIGPVALNSFFPLRSIFMLVELVIV